MIDINLIRQNPDLVKKGVENKNKDPKVVDQVLELDEKRRSALSAAELLRSERNKLSKNPTHEMIAQAKKVKEDLKKADEDLKSIEKDFNAAINLIPNLPASDVPVGKNENDNQIIKKWGEPKEFDFKPLDHLELGEKLDLIDFEAGAKVAGSQFYYLKNDAVRLEYALLQFGMELLTKKGFRLFTTPDLAKSRYYLGTGYNPKGDEAQIYEIKDTDLGLIATSEVTMAGYHADEVLNKKDLPLKYAAISHCFRQEAGAYGKYSKGLYRVHQFTKLEMFVYAVPSDSTTMHDELLAIEEEIMQKLNISYRVVEMCSGDLGAIAAKKYDIDAWMPGRNDYGEVTSTSNTTDYQARNLNIKYRDGDHNEHVHMLNGTAIAISRMLIAIMENYQNKDGSITIPEALQKWMGKDVVK